MPAPGLRSLVIAALILPTFLWCQTPIRVCVALDGKDVLLDTGTRLAQALTQLPERKGTSLFGIALPPGDKLKIMTEARRERCVYLIDLRWVLPESVEIREFPAPVPGLNGVPLNPSANLPSYSPAVSAESVADGRPTMFYTISRVGEKGVFASGYSVSPAGRSTALRENYSRQLAGLLMKKIIP
jgi:hypothetical protein